MIYESTIFLHILLILGIVYQTMLSMLTNTVNLFKAHRQVPVEPRCEIRFHSRPDWNWW